MVEEVARFAAEFVTLDLINKKNGGTFDNSDVDLGVEGDGHRKNLKFQNKNYAFLIAASERGFTRTVSNFQVCYIA